MAAEVADAWAFPRGAVFLISFFLAVTIVCLHFPAGKSPDRFHKGWRIYQTNRNHPQKSSKISSARREINLDPWTPPARKLDSIPPRQERRTLAFHQAQNVRSSAPLKSFPGGCQIPGKDPCRSGILLLYSSWATGIGATQKNRLMAKRSKFEEVRISASPIRWAGDRDCASAQMAAPPFSDRPSAGTMRLSCKAGRIQQGNHHYVNPFQNSIPLHGSRISSQWGNPIGRAHKNSARFVL